MERQYQEQLEMPQELGGSIPTPSMVADRADLLDKIKPEKVVEDLRYNLMGYSKIKGKWVQDPALKNNAISYRGAWDIATNLKAITSQNTSLSDLTEDEVKLRVEKNIHTITKLCVSNWKEYNITNTAQLEYVINLIMNVIFITLKQSQDEGIRDLIRNTSKWSSGGYSSEKKQEGVFSKFFRSAR